MRGTVEFSIAAWSFCSKQLHDQLDTVVATAYGWDAALSDEALLAKIATLNRERAREEGRGSIRWLRPDYQISLFGGSIDRQAATEVETQIGADLLIRKTAQKPSFPPDDVAQTAAVMAAFAQASSSLDSGTLASSFKQGRRIEAKVRAVVAALASMGFVVSADGGKSFILRRVS